MAPVLDFDGRSVFVAGGTSGINLGIAEGFASAGARLAVMSRSREKVDAAVSKLQSHGAEAVGYAADVRDYEAVTEALTAAHGKLGPLDILVSGAAGNFPASALGMSPNGFKSVIDIDVIGTYHVLRAAHPFLKKPGASVINISAPQAYVPMQYQSHVCAAKAGVDMLTRVLAMEWGGDGIRINSIVPGPIAGTEGMSRLAPGDNAIEAVAKTVPVGRVGEVEDIAQAALFLGSELSAYISGAILPVDGGWSLAGSSTSMAALADVLKRKEER